MIELEVVGQTVRKDRREVAISRTGKAIGHLTLWLEPSESMEDFPLGAKFVLLPANLAVAPLFEQKLDQLTDTTLSVMQRAK